MSHTLFPRWYDWMEFQKGLIEITVITRISASSKLLQVPFSFSKYRSLAYILLCKYLIFKFALPFSLPRTYKRLVQPYRGFLWLSRYSETFLRTFITHMHIQSFTMNFQWKKKVPWNGAVSMRSRAGSWETLSICITLRHNQGAPADMHANALGILIICRFPLA